MYKLKKIVGSHNFSAQFIKIISHYERIGYTVGTQRAYFELKYFKIVKMRDAKYSLKMAAEKWRQIFPFLNALYS